MEIIKRFSTLNTTPKADRKIEYIVIHYTAGVTSRSGAAMNTANYYPTTSNVSADFTVDDTCAVQYNGEIRNRYCWHCGGSKYSTKGGSLYGKCTNTNSIGVEVCSTNSTGKIQAANDKSYSFTEAAVSNAVELVKKLMDEYDIPINHVVRHYDVTGKPCPGIIGWNKESGSEAEWNKFKSRVFDGSDPNAVKKYYRVQSGAFEKRENAETLIKTLKTRFPDIDFIIKYY